jgi:hypothetical protein
MHLSFSRAGVDFIKLFSPSEKLPTHGVLRKICHSISPTKLKAKNKVKICQIYAPFTKKCQILIAFAKKEGKILARKC